MSEEQGLTFELDPLRNAHVTHRTARPSEADRLEHRLLGTHALEHRVRADAVRQLFDALDARISPLGDDVGGAELTREMLTRRMAAHGDDSPCTHLARRHHSQQAD